ncbi:MAG: hypothetical protein EA424_20110 [Planctomycetaceae bacterium]|nr:MAG: hypothetical protein EA424_20110 [Planctomycetaceae bacterium]
MLDFDVFVPRHPIAQGGRLEGTIETFDLVVMTQTCDIAHGKVASLLLCPWWDLWRFVEAVKAKGENFGSDLRESLRRGNLPGYHLLNEVSQDGIEFGVGVVDFHEVHTAPLDQVKAFAKSAGKRLRLRPPYREHLAQAFARFFMRVGLPVDVPREKVKKKPG